MDWVTNNQIKYWLIDYQFSYQIPICYWLNTNWSITDLVTSYWIRYWLTDIITNLISNSASYYQFRLIAISRQSPKYNICTLKVLHAGSFNSLLPVIPLWFHDCLPAQRVQCSETPQASPQVLPLNSLPLQDCLPVWRVVHPRTPKNIVPVLDCMTHYFKTLPRITVPTQRVMHPRTPQVSPPKYELLIWALITKSNTDYQMKYQ